MSAPESHDDASHPTKKATMNGLAVIGFFGLIVAGVLLAVYASRYVPETLARLSSAVYLSSDGAKNATTTPPAAKPSTPTFVTTPEPTNPTPIATSTKPKVPNETGYTPRTTTYTYPVQTGPRLYGSADLALTAVQAGYFSGSSFVESDRVPSGRNMGLRFTVRNTGTNIASGWLVRVRVEGQQDAVAQGGVLYPNGYQDFVLGVSNPDSGSISTRIDVDYTNAVLESNESNNSDTIDMEVNGSGSGSSNSSNVSCNLDASDTRVSEGDRVTLSWDTDGNPNYASINEGVGRVDEDGGTERVTVDNDTTYRMTVRNRDGDEDTCSVTVRVD